MTEDSTMMETAETDIADVAMDRVGEVQTSFNGPEGLAPEELERFTRDITLAIKTVYDPEIPADIYELGLIYKVDLDDNRNVVIDMTLTAPGCPVAGEMPGWVENAVCMVEGVNSVTVNMVFDPPWTPDRMSDEARVMLDFFY